MAHAETRFRLSAKRTSQFKSTGGGGGALVQSTTGSRGVRINGSNSVYTMFRGSVKSTGYPTPFDSFLFTSPSVRHRMLSHFNWTLPRTPFPGIRRPGQETNLSPSMNVWSCTSTCAYFFVAYTGETLRFLELHQE
jgi:hypothetical protein